MLEGYSKKHSNTAGKIIAGIIAGILFLLLALGTHRNRKATMSSKRSHTTTRSRSTGRSTAR